MIFNNSLSGNKTRPKEQYMLSNQTGTEMALTVSTMSCPSSSNFLYNSILDIITKERPYVINLQFTYTLLTQ